MAISNESYRTISNDFGYTESSLKRHKLNHLIIDLADVREVMQQTRESALAEVRDRELEEIRVEAAETVSGRLEQAVDFFGQLKILRERAALALEQAEGAEDIKSILAAIRELRELVRIWAELEGRIQATNITVTQDVTIYDSPQWLSVGAILARILAPYPDLRIQIAEEFLALQEAPR